MGFTDGFSTVVIKRAASAVPEAGIRALMIINSAVFGKPRRHRRSGAKALKKNVELKEFAEIPGIGESAAAGVVVRDRQKSAFDPERTSTG
jgi:hypothetical protein